MVLIWKFTDDNFHLVELGTAFVFSFGKFAATQPQYPYQDVGLVDLIVIKENTQPIKINEGARESSQAAAPTNCDGASYNQGSPYLWDYKLHDIRRAGL